MTNRHHQTLFGEIRSLLASEDEPTWSIWRALTELLDQANDDFLEGVLVPYCKVQLTRWPVELCQIPNIWWKKYQKHQRAPGLALVRYYSGHETTAEEIEHLVNHPDMTGLEVFSIQDNEWTIGARGGQLLAEAPTMANLRVLELYNSAAGVGSALAIAQSPYLRKLETLGLRDCYIQDQGMIALAHSDVLRTVTSLSVADCHLTDESINELSRSQNVGTLHTLNIGNNPISGVAIARLAHSENVKHLRALTIRYNPSGGGDAGVLGIAASPHLEQLESLWLYYNHITEAGARALFTSKTLPSLEKLDLSANPIGDGAISALCEHSLPKLHTLNLSNTSITAEGVRRLCAWPGLSKLKSLWLGHNALGIEGARILAACSDVANIEDFFVAKKDVTDEGFELLQGTLRGFG